MRLLDKRVVHTEVAKQKKSQIDDGLNLAKKIDTLRVTHAKEERELDQFRKESIKNVQVEIDLKIKERDFIAAVNSKLLEDRVALLVPLDTEWEKIGIEKERLSNNTIELLRRSETVTEREKVLTLEEEMVLTEKQRIASMRERITEKLEIAEQNRKEARDTLTNARTEAQTIFSQAHLKERQVHAREKGVEEWEQELSKREEALSNKEADIARREIVLKDRYETLQRTIERIDHGRRSNR